MIAADDAYHIGLILTPKFSLLAFASCVEPLRGANLIQGDILYRWTYLSPEGGLVASSSGVGVLCRPLSEAPEAHLNMLIVCGGMESRTYRNARLHAFLRQMSRRGAIVGSLSTATFILASAGLLDGRRCTVHWDYLGSFREAYPRLDVTDDLFVIDGGVFTCAGGTSCMDVMLQFIRQHRGDRLANLVSDQFIYGAIRQPQDAQRQAIRERFDIVQPAVVKAIEIMERHVETPLRLPQIAERVGISARQLERLFKAELGCSPARHYIQTRLEAARKLLRRTTLSVLEVTVACGFTSPSHFARSYRQHFKVLPHEDRKAETISFLPTTAAATSMTVRPESSSEAAGARQLWPPMFPRAVRSSTAAAQIS